MQRYAYTFEQVVEESKEYELVEVVESDHLKLTRKGRLLLVKYREGGSGSFNRTLLTFMEEKFMAFKLLVEFLYKANPSRSGVLIFPHYSPLQLHFKRKNMQTAGDIFRYADKLVNKLQEDIRKYLKREENLKEKSKEILEKLIKAGPNCDIIDQDFVKGRTEGLEYERAGSIPAIDDPEAIDLNKKAMENRP